MPKKTEDGERKVDLLIEAMFDVLPASSYDEIAARLGKKMRRDVSLAEVNNALNVLRSNPDDYVYTVPHVKRGIGTEGEEERFRAVLIKNDGTFEYTKEVRRDLIAGLRSTVASIASMGKHEAYALRETADYDTTTVRKAMLRDLADDLAYVSRKAESLLGTIIKKAA